jgi:hypothetical protein
MAIYLVLGIRGIYYARRLDQKKRHGDGEFANDSRLDRQGIFDSAAGRMVARVAGLDLPLLADAIRNQARRRKSSRETMELKDFLSNSDLHRVETFRNDRNVKGLVVSMKDAIEVQYWSQDEGIWGVFQILPGSPENENPASQIVSSLRVESPSCGVFGGSMPQIAVDFPPRLRQGFKRRSP